MLALVVVIASYLVISNSSTSGLEYATPTPQVIQRSDSINVEIDMPASSTRKENTVASVISSPQATSDQYSHKEWAIYVFAKNRLSEAYNFSRYVLLTRVGDSYWFEAVPIYIKTAHALGILDHELKFIVDQTLQSSVEYPDQTDIIQDAIFVGAIESLMEVRRYDLAKLYTVNILSNSISDRLRENCERYIEMLKIIESDLATGN